MLEVRAWISGAVFLVDFGRSCIPIISGENKNYIYPNKEGYIPSYSFALPSHPPPKVKLLLPSEERGRAQPTDVFMLLCMMI